MSTTLSLTFSYIVKRRESVENAFGFFPHVFVTVSSHWGEWKHFSSHWVIEKHVKDI